MNAFDPGSLRADARIEVWEPRREVRLRRPFGLPAIGCLPGVLLVFAGPAVFMTTHAEGRQRVLAAVVAGLFGLVFGGLAAVVVYTSLPRTIVFDWPRRRLEVRGLLSRRGHDFKEIRAIGLERRRMRRDPGGGPEKIADYCDVTALLATPGKEPQRFVLLSTRADDVDAQAPFRASLPFVTELAAALEVPTDIGEPPAAGWKGV